jgi:hypothetical protein
MTSIRVINVQQTNLETQAQMDLSIMPQMFPWWTPQNARIPTSGLFLGASKCLYPEPEGAELTRGSLSNGSCHLNDFHKHDRYSTLETHGGYHCEAQVDPSECFYSGLHMILECRDTKLWCTVGCIIIMSRP